MKTDIKKLQNQIRLQWVFITLLAVFLAISMFFTWTVKDSGETSDQSIVDMVFELQLKRLE